MDKEEADKTLDRGEVASAKICRFWPHFFSFFISYQAT